MYKFNKIYTFKLGFDELDSSLAVWKIENPNPNNRIQRNQAWKTRLGFLKFSRILSFSKREILSETRPVLSIGFSIFLGSRSYISYYYNNDIVISVMYFVILIF